MKQATILLIEDNPITRKMLEVCLRGAGWAVVTAATGKAALMTAGRHKPDLILQDLLLPDMDGFDLVKRLRALTGMGSIPILAISGMPSKVEQARSLQPGFSDYLSKPVSLEHLVETVRAYLPAAGAAGGQPGSGKRVILAEADPLQMKLLRVHIEKLGFRVSTAATGEEALKAARRHRPDAIVCDVLIPQLDGFRLCVRVRQDSQLAHVPVLLISGAAPEIADQELSRAVGATALVIRSADNHELTQALLTCLANGNATASTPTELPLEDYTRRIIQQLERQVTLSSQLGRRVAMLEAKLGILGRILETLETSATTEAVLGELLYRLLDAAGIAQGAAYLLEADGRLVLRTHIGYPAAAMNAVAGFFGRQDLLYQVLKTGEPAEVRVPRYAPATQKEKSDPETPHEQSVVLAPLVQTGKPLGILALMSPAPGVSEDWVAFARVAGSQISQAIELTHTVARLQTSEQRYRDLVQGLDAVVWEAEGPHRQFTFLSRRALDLFGFPLERWLTEPDFWARFIHPEDRDETLTRFRQAVARGQSHFLAYRAIASDGRTIWLHDTVRVVQSGEGRPALLRGVMVDATPQHQAEEALRRGESLLRAVIEGTTDAVFVKDRQGRYLMINPAGARFLGKSVAEVLGRDDRELFSPESGEHIMRGDRQVMESGRVQTYEETVTAGGITRTYLATKGPFRDLQGNLQGMIGISRDITEHKRMEEQDVKMRLAREIQQRFFPAAPPRIEGLDISGASHPAEVTGGDYFDFILLPDRQLAVVVADASGHGFAAALLMAETQAYLRALTLTRTDLAEVMSLLNRALASQHQGEACFVTLILLQIDPTRRTYRYASAGHAPGYHLDAAGQVRTVLKSNAIPLGIDSAASFPSSEEISLDAGDIIILLTDGMIEAAPPSGTAIGTDRLLDTARAHRTDSASAIRSKLFEAVNQYCHNTPPTDDRTAVILKSEALAKS